MIDLKQKNVVITGASGDIGQSLVKKFAEHGSNVFLLSRNITKMKNIISNIPKDKDQILMCYSLDVSNESNVKDVFEGIIKDYNINILINNAGITLDNLFIKMKTQQWNDVINTNLNGCYYCSKAVIKNMIKQRSGCIINISSIIGLIGNKGQSNYAASKAAILGLTKSLAKEVSSRNININAINPGYIETKMTKDLTNKNEFLNSIPLQRFGLPDEVADLACFLASAKASYITGQAINIDGGMVM